MIPTESRNQLRIQRLETIPALRPSRITLWRGEERERELEELGRVDHGSMLYKIKKNRYV